MIEIESTSDTVRLSYLQAILTDAGIRSYVFDANSPWPGAIQQRLLVSDEDAELAERTIRDAEAG